MQRKPRKLRTAAALAAATLLLAGCGGDAGGAQTGGTGADASGTDLLIWTGGGPGGEATKQLAATFGNTGLAVRG